MEIYLDNIGILMQLPYVLHILFKHVTAILNRNIKKCQWLSTVIICQIPWLWQLRIAPEGVEAAPHRSKLVTHHGRHWGLGESMMISVRGSRQQDPTSFMQASHMWYQKMTSPHLPTHQTRSNFSACSPQEWHIETLVQSCSFPSSVPDSSVNLLEFLFCWVKPPSLMEPLWPT